MNFKKLQELLKDSKNTFRFNVYYNNETSLMTVKVTVDHVSAREMGITPISVTGSPEMLDNEWFEAIKAPLSELDTMTNNIAEAQAANAKKLADLKAMDDAKKTTPKAKEKPASPKKTPEEIEAENLKKEQEETDKRVKAFREFNVYIKAQNIGKAIKEFKGLNQYKGTPEHLEAEKSIEGFGISLDMFNS